MTVQDYILLLLFNSLWIFGLYKLFEAEFYDMDNPEQGIEQKSKGGLSFITVWCVKKFGSFYSKPLCLCPPCMASVHSSYVFWLCVFLFGHITLLTIIVYLFYAVCLSGLNTLIVYLLNIETTK